MVWYFRNDDGQWCRNNGSSWVVPGHNLTSFVIFVLTLHNWFFIISPTFFHHHLFLASNVSIFLRLSWHQPWSSPSWHLCQHIHPHSFWNGEVHPLPPGPPANLLCQECLPLLFLTHWDVYLRVGVGLIIQVHDHVPLRRWLLVVWYDCTSELGLLDKHVS